MNRSRATPVWGAYIPQIRKIYSFWVTIPHPLTDQGEM